MMGSTRLSSMFSDNFIATQVINLMDDEDEQSEAAEALLQGMLLDCQPPALHHPGYAMRNRACLWRLTMAAQCKASRTVSLQLMTGMSLTKML